MKNSNLMENETIQVDGKLYKKAKVVMLPTKKEPKQNHNILKCIHDSGVDKSGYCLNDLCLGTNSFSNKVWELQHLYFLSDKEIKRGDYFYSVRGLIEKAIIDYPKGEHIGKVIASTDESLKYSYQERVSRDDVKTFEAGSLPRPSNEFLNGYCASKGKIDEVLVEFEEHLEEDTSKDYIVGKGQPCVEWHILKVSPDNTIAIKKVEEKMYNKDEVRNLLDSLWDYVMDNNHDKSNSREYDKWTEENL